MNDTEKGTQMTKRVPCTPETHKRLQGFAHGIGFTFDDVLNFLLDEMIDGKPSWSAGEDLQPKGEEWLKNKKAIKGKKDKG